jgi:hypothetical protein
MHDETAVPRVVCLRFLRTEASLGPMLCNIRCPYIHINTQEGDPNSSILALASLPLSHNTAPWSLRRGWLPMMLGTVFKSRSSPLSPSRWSRLRRLCSKNFIVYGYATRQRRGCPRAAPSLISSTSCITTRPRFGALTRWMHTMKPSIGCKVRTMEEPSLSRGWLTLPPSSRGWPTYAWADPVVRHSSHEQRKETYKLPTCWSCSSTTSTA